MKHIGRKREDRSMKGRKRRRNWEEEKEKEKVRIEDEEEEKEKKCKRYVRKEVNEKKEKKYLGKAEVKRSIKWRSNNQGRKKKRRTC